MPLLQAIDLLLKPQRQRLQRLLQLVLLPSKVASEQTERAVVHQGLQDGVFHELAFDDHRPRLAQSLVVAVLSVLAAVVAPG